MANTDCTYQKEGYVIIGVADNDKASSDWTAIYHETPLAYGAHRVVGIANEAVVHFGDVDKYALKGTKTSHEADKDK